jgi:flagellar biosynthetic protein FlhB
MAQRDPSRTEAATPKRRRKVRSEGNVPKSQELPKPITLLAGLVALQMSIHFLYQEMGSLMDWFFTEGMRFELTPASTYALFQRCLASTALMVAPVLLTVAGAAYLTLRLQVGSLWAPKVFRPKLRVFNPAAGLKRILMSKDTFIRLAKSALMAAAVAIGPYLVLHRAFGEVLPLVHQTPEAIAVYILKTGADMFRYALVPMLLIGIADLLYTRWDYEENIKMTKHEVKDERKQAEGDPVIKSKQRQKMLAVMKQRMMQEVPKADVVVTNPTHLAIALRYDPKEAPAPIVVAKGAGALAERIRELARQHGVPIRENKPLARALYKSVDVGQTIPEDLYQAVAALLAQIYKIRPRRT